VSDGLLIVNADDWGYDAPTTDAIARCFGAGRVTSASAMVFMEDSERAAELARREGLPTGLHLNLVEPYSGATVDAAMRERQQRLAAHFTRHRLARWTWNPRLAGLVRAVARDQLDEYRRLYGTEPSHADGHQHMHLAPTVLGSGALVEFDRVRPHFTFRASEKSVPNRLVRRATNAYLARRHATTRGFFSIRTIHPALGGRGLGEVLAESRLSPVEVMTHPGWPDELAVLLSDGWQDAIQRERLGSYLDLPANGRLPGTV
jgi:predicted glycoside hydrolase/deacetylase ChbG (UPF0249 family)